MSDYLYTAGVALMGIALGDVINSVGGYSPTLASAAVSGVAASVVLIAAAVVKS